MINLSLRARAVLGGLVWIIFAVGLSGYVLVSAFDDISKRTFDRKLISRLDQMETLIRSGALDPDAATKGEANQRLGRPPQATTGRSRRLTGGSSDRRRWATTSFPNPTR